MITIFRRVYEAWLVFIGVVAAGSLVEVFDGANPLLNVLAISAYLSILVLEAIRLKKRKVFWLCFGLFSLTVLGFYFADYYLIRNQVYLHWSDLITLGLGYCFAGLRYRFHRDELNA